MLRRRLGSPSIKFLPEEHRLLAVARELGLSRKRLLFAVSGGIDSIVLLHAFVRLNGALNNEIVVGHVHHGAAKTKKQKKFRDDARNFVKKECDRLGCEFISNRKWGRKVLASEEELREFRYRCLEEWRESLNVDAIVLAHHRDDLLETRLIRLIRGTGVSGLVGMTGMDRHIARPMLHFWKKDIEVWAKKLKLRHMVDPSNSDVDPLRNWLRHKWIPALEKFRSGSGASLARSLETICEEVSNLHRETMDEVFAGVLKDGAIVRSELTRLPKTMQKSVLAAFLQHRGVRNYTQGQIEEILRRLDNPQGNFSFTVLKHRWRINAGLIHIEPNS